MRKKVVLYNPAAPYFTLPLQYLALASVLDPEKYDVRIVDARIERSAEDAHRKVNELLENAVCLGVSIITGTPIKDAIAITGLCKSRFPGVPVVWGGWHPSIFPEQCIREGGADFCISGQGEATFVELLEAIESDGPYDNIPGLTYQEKGECLNNGERKFMDINSFPPYNYDLLPLESYFERKGLRQLDFYSSQGCPYRCAFCADPFVYNRRWSGLKGARMLSDVFDAVRKYAIDDVVFQDENFFANRDRVLKFCNGVNEQGMRFSWTATSRADQIAPLDDDFLDEIAKANLRRVMIGAESGSQEMLDFMKKDTLTEETIVSAEKLARHGIGASFNFIVGFPEEGFSNTLKTLDTIKELKKIQGSFEFNIFFFTPYPGTELFNYIVKKGFRVPHSLLEWSDLDFTLYAGYWVSASEKRYVEGFQFYTKLATEHAARRVWLAPLRLLARARTRNDFFDLPVEKSLVDLVRYRILHDLKW
jgi:radical SAM superfamily enzyme YgiQ (UPF0313 family)